MTFSELGIRPIFQEALLKEDISIPTEIQNAAIPAILAGDDVYLSSETGTGKTLAYLLPLLSKIDFQLRAVQFITITPTHELALQVQQQIQTLRQNSNEDIRSLLLIGGVSTKRQLEKLKKKPQLVIGSAGRIREIIKLRKLKVHHCQTVVVDEMDRLLFGDSYATIAEIIKSTLKSRQLIFASATAQTESSAQAEKLANNLLKVHKGCNQVNSNIDHDFLVCEERDKLTNLRKIIHAENPTRAIIFLHRNANVDWVSNKLAFHKLKVVNIHGNCDKNQRKNALTSFRGGKAQILIASDVAARGLDIKDVTHIINLDIPLQSKAYLHRVGRCGRAGKKGLAISLMTKEETRMARRYERELNIEMNEVDIHNGKIFKLD